MRLVTGLLAVLLAAPVAAEAPWDLGERLAVTDSQGPRVFHHLESAGQGSFAVSGERVAVVWADNRSGTARIYAAFKAKDKVGFQREVRLREKGPAYAPAVTALDSGGFLVAWEDEGASGSSTLGLRAGP
ncbi:hypothetical protein [Thiohalorhabdus sp.]|uniref:hypothetical protein n=1 Tax=Thiohalorhabdus sp. TaxID=3094134 RepID=UPI002FC2B706